MEADGWVESTWDDQETQGPPRRVYRIAENGSEVLAEWAKELQESKSRIEKFLVEYEKGGA
jgi:DNA-binding PadR family transcriptional regulator